MLPSQCGVSKLRIVDITCHAVEFNFINWCFRESAVWHSIHLRIIKMLWQPPYGVNHFCHVQFISFSECIDKHWYKFISLMIIIQLILSIGVKWDDFLSESIIWESKWAVDVNECVILADDELKSMSLLTEFCRAAPAPNYFENSSPIQRGDLLLESHRFYLPPCSHCSVLLSRF